MKIEIVETKNITTYVGIRASADFSKLGESVNHAFIELRKRKDEIGYIKDQNITYGITPPNYKGNTGIVDFYCCYEVEPMINLPHGMVHIQLFIDANVERHDYLLVSEERLPETWEHVCTGDGGDQGTTFNFQWITSDKLHLVDDEFRKHITMEYIEELF